MAKDELTEQYLGALLWELYETKERCRKLLKENTDLKIELAKTTVKLEMLEAFQGKDEQNEN